MEVMSDKSIPEFAPFGFTLALRVAQLLKSEPHRADCVGKSGDTGRIALVALGSGALLVSWCCRRRSCHPSMACQPGAWCLMIPSDDLSTQRPLTNPMGSHNLMASHQSDGLSPT